MEKKIVVTFLIGLLYLGACHGQATFDQKLRAMYKNTVPLVYPQQLDQSKLKGVVLLDTRSKAEFDVSHIQGATFIDYDSFNPADVQGLDRHANIVVYCAVGYRSERIGEKLLEMGFYNVRNLYGGIVQWSNVDKPVINKKDLPTDSVHTGTREWSVWLTRGIKVY